MSEVGYYVNAFAKTTAGVVCDQAILAASATLEFQLPREWSLIGDIRVTVQGDAKTDAASADEIVEMITDFKIITTKGGEVHFSTGLDLFKWSGWVMHGNNKIGCMRTGGAADNESAITYLYPLGLGPQKWYNGDGDFFGLPGHMADRLVITFADDTEIDSKQLTVEYDGLMKGPMPVAYQCLDVYGYTPAAGAVTDIRLPQDALLRGVYGFSTHHFDDEGTETTLVHDKIAIVKAMRVVLETQPLSRQYGVQSLETDTHDAPTDGGVLSLESDAHWFWDLDFGEGGHGYEIDADLAIRATAALNEASRLYRVTYSLVNPQ